MGTEAVELLPLFAGAGSLSLTILVTREHREPSYLRLAEAEGHS